MYLERDRNRETGKRMRQRKRETKKINESKSRLFENINKIDKLLARKRKEETYYQYLK